MNDREPISVLVLCTGNSCRSVLAEVLFNELGKGRIRAYSAGSKPTGRVNPGALQQLQREGHSVAGLRSKSWLEFSADDAPPIDIVVTVCDSAASESCPIWPGAPVTVHWGIADPAEAPDDVRRAAFEMTYRQLCTRIAQVLELPLASLDSRYWKDALQRIHDAATTQESVN